MLALYKLCFTLEYFLKFKISLTVLMLLFVADETILCPQHDYFINKVVYFQLKPFIQALIYF